MPEHSYFKSGAKGTDRGRVMPALWTPPHGEWVFCLGFNDKNTPFGIDEELTLPTQVWNDPVLKESKSWTEASFSAPYGMRTGDRQQVSQDINLTGINLVRAAFYMNLPTISPDGKAWELAILIDGIKESRMVMTRKRARARRDMAANVSKIDGIHNVAFRLTLVDE